MTRRQMLTSLALRAASLASLRETAMAASGPNIRWAVSMFLWTSTQWGDHAPVPFTDMLDVIKDAGFDGFRFVGWPESLAKYDLTLGFLDRELSKRGLQIATLSFPGGGSAPAKPAA